MFGQNLGHCLLPGSFAGVPYLAKIFRVTQHQLFTVKPPRDDALPSRNVQHEFPNGVCGGNRTVKRSLGVHAIQNLH